MKPWIWKLIAADGALFLLMGLSRLVDGPLWLALVSLTFSVGAFVLAWRVRRVSRHRVNDETVSKPL